MRTVDAPTGTALIAVDDSGENTIIVDAGANAALIRLTEAEAEADADAIALRAADVLVVNEHEAAHLSRDVTGDRNGSTDKAGALAPVVIVTRGARGAVLHEKGSNEILIPAPQVKSIDATGAGDIFCDVLEASLAEGMAVETAVRFAVVTASLSVQRAGAVPSIPRRAIIDDASSTGNRWPDSA